MTTEQLFRTRFPFVCDRCDYGYRARRLAGFDADHRLVCAKCLIGEDPDAANDSDIPASEETSPCNTTSQTPETATLFD